MTVILPRRNSSSLATPAPQPVLDHAEGTVILSAGNAPASVTPDVSPSAAASAGLPPESMALQLERQKLRHADLEKTGKGIVAGVFAALAVLVVVAVSGWWFLMREEAAVEAPLAAESAPPVAESLQQQPFEVVTPEAAVQASELEVVAPVVTASATPEPVAASVSVPAGVDKPRPITKPAPRLSEEEEYLRQIRRQLDQR